MMPSLEPIHHHVVASGTEIHYWEYNPEATKTILMVHGFRGTHHGLEKLISKLPEFRIIVPDLPGFGESPAMTALPHTTRSYAQVLLEFMKVTKLKKPALFGHSMGSIIVSDMTSVDPDCTSRMIFVNPIAERPVKGLGAVKIAPGILYHWLAGKILPEKIGMRILTNKYLFLLGSATMTKTKDPSLRRWIHGNHMEYMKRFANRKSLLEAYHSSSTTTIDDYSDKLQHPILMVAGKKDAIAPIKGQRKLAQKMDAQLVELDDVGHIIHYEKPEEAAAAIKEFMKDKQ